MYCIKSEKVWRNVIGLVICFCALLSADCIAQHAGIPPLISSGQNDIADLTIPFVLPEQLYEGSYLEFPNAFAKKEFRYAGEGVIRVYFYKTRELAEKDMRLYAEKNQKISKEESSILAEHLGCIQEKREDLITTAWFTIDSYTVEIQVPNDRMERKKLLKTGEGIISNYKERINRMFSTPEKCFETYLKAVDAQNADLIMECMYNDGSEKTKGSLMYLKAMMPYLSMASMAHGVQEKKEDIKFGKVEIISDNEAKLPITSDAKIIQGSSAGMLLYMGGYGGSYDVPFRKANGKWGIDYAKLQERSLDRARNQAHKNICISNLRTLYHAMEEYMIDNNVPIGTTLSATTEPLIGPTKYIKAVPKCPYNDKTYPSLTTGQKPVCPNAGLPECADHKLP